MFGTCWFQLLYLFDAVFRIVCGYVECRFGSFCCIFQLVSSFFLRSRMHFLNKFFVDSTGRIQSIVSIYVPTYLHATSMNTFTYLL